MFSQRLRSSLLSTLKNQVVQHRYYNQLPSANADQLPLTSHILSEIRQHARKNQTPVSLKYMFVFGSNPTTETLLTGARFLHKELPIRLARRAAELESLPYGLSLMPSVKLVKNWYVQSFLEIQKHIEIRTTEQEAAFTQTLQGILTRHTHVVPTIAQGILELKRSRPEFESVGAPEIDESPYLTDFLDRFYMARIGVRMLIGQHIALHHPIDGFVGIIDGKCSARKIIQDAAQDASRLCERHYGIAPEVRLHGKLDLTFKYVPEHFYYMMFELLKNSMRATVEFHNKNKYDAPPIDVVVADGQRDISIKISDQGGGIPRNNMQRIWTYRFTTAKNPVLNYIETSGETVSAVVNPPMAGFGYGLPISRLYARYFGGDLSIMSMENFGTDAYLHLNKLGDSEEYLPA